MNATELMIGDWVLQSNGNAVKIDWVKTGEYCYYDKYGKMEIACTPLLEPIPLTPEILEKNGFDKYQQKESCPYYYIQGLSLRYHVHGEYFYIDTYAVDIRFKFVHELQHALRLCGLSDLADNFKI